MLEIERMSNLRDVATSNRCVDDHLAEARHHRVYDGTHAWLSVSARGALLARGAERRRMGGQAIHECGVVGAAADTGGRSAHMRALGNPTLHATSADASWNA